MEFEYQVFLSHNSADKPEVKLLANRLLSKTGLRPFLDEWNLVPGESSQAKLVGAIETSATAAIFYGPHKEGPWQNEEIQVLLDKAARSRDDFRAIPVLLPGASEKDLSPFLKQRTWVDFRSGLDNDSAFERLIAGIKGTAVEPNGYELPDDPAPYRGLERFEAEQKDYFFGREADIRKLMERLANGRFVAIVGASAAESHRWSELVSTPSLRPKYSRKFTIGKLSPFFLEVIHSERWQNSWRARYQSRIGSGL